MPKSKLIAVLIGILAAAGIGFLTFRGVNSPRETASVVETKWKKGEEDKGGEREKRDKGETDWTTYENSSFGFSLKHPKEFRVSEFDDERGRAIVFQEPGKNKEFQIFISEFDEPAFVETSAGKARTLTVERIRRDVSGFLPEETQQVKIGGAEALVFFSNDPSVGKLREAWFIWPEDPKRSGNYLFQVTARAEFDEELSRIMATLAFK